MTSKEGAAIIEAILFTMGDSVEINSLAKAMEASAKEVKESIEYLKTKYENEDSGIGIIELENAVHTNLLPSKDTKTSEKNDYLCGLCIAHLPYSASSASAGPTSWTS